MNKIEIIEEINKLNLDKNKFWIVGTASLVLRDLIKEANDIDLAITNELYQEIKNNLTFLGTNHNSKWYSINNTIECCIDTLTQDKVEKSDPFNLIDLSYYYNNFIKDSTRKKDLEKKVLLHNILFK